MTPRRSSRPLLWLSWPSPSRCSEPARAAESVQEPFAATVTSAPSRRAGPPLSARTANPEVGPAHRRRQRARVHRDVGRALGQRPPAVPESGARAIASEGFRENSPEGLIQIRTRWGSSASTRRRIPSGPVDRGLRGGGPARPARERGRKQGEGEPARGIGAKGGHPGPMITANPGRRQERSHRPPPASRPPGPPPFRLPF